MILMRRQYILISLLMIPFLIVLSILYDTPLFMAPVPLFLFYISRIIGINTINDSKSLYRYIKRYYGKEIADKIQQNFKVVNSFDLLDNNSLIIFDNILILKINNKIGVFEIEEGIDYLIRLMNYV
ncbi:hypothetical protein [Sulfolobus acidocaldarius]|uniref:Conserved membrane protein n=5 Tax=Sulfolobus acidocaldarius TaxID=2285 RepID=Q4J9K3_SULAC|nr:hypothetical protein [Sulfolobus acidocaldarius]AAY80526.1 conserved membrane protein [Sulfolobus acidocaldarius DSM 639]AGE71115.1 hypothetical protein SacN8_05750 [Sulfolobus acidocaldarius N8]AGE73385.1 hypothetical protein SacRon12I_05745 [Sulfolobus acidocaldarius Ron12/I]ALU28609.1 hypothetical protein ATY89_00595 [Sulfolobus acidocaldarius]ALU31324.1 hypothetical protein ATZ20_03640 [Sulfolobus acidocaldarius]